MNRQDIQTGHILRKLYLTLFLRGGMAAGTLRKRKQTPTSVGRKMGISLVIYALSGLVFLGLASRAVFPFSLNLHNMTMLFVILFVSGSAGHVLFDEKENEILLHRPVAPEQILRAKIHVMVEISLWIALAFNLGGLVLGSLSNWRHLPAHLFSTGMLVLFCTSAVVLAYQICLRLFGREKLESVMATGQVLLIVLAYVSIYMLPRLADSEKYGAVLGIDTLPAGLFWLPSAWFAGLDSLLTGSQSPNALFLAALATSATLGVSWLAVVRLSAIYRQGMQKLAEHSPPTARESTSRRRWIELVSRMPVFSRLLRKPEVAAGFRLSLAYMLRDRHTKLTLYPGLTPLVILPLIMLVPRSLDGANSASPFLLAFASSYLALLPLYAANIFQFSKDSEAFVFFHLSPMRGPGPLVHGARLAIMILLGVPSVLLLVILGYLVTKSPAHLVMLLPGILSMPVYAHLAGVLGKGVPLSRPPEDAQSGNRGLWMIGATIPTLIVSGLGLLAWKTQVFGFFLAAEVLLVALLCLLMKRKIDKSTWPRINPPPQASPPHTGTPVQSTPRG